MPEKRGHTLIRVSRTTNERLLAARVITGRSVSAMVEEAVASYLKRDLMEERLEVEYRRRLILLGQPPTP